jgi:putative DNA primase/helicase
MSAAKVHNIAADIARLDREADWRAELAGNGSGYFGDERNVLVALRRSELAGLLRFNEFALNLEFTRAPPWRKAAPGTVWTEADDTQCAAWLQAQGLKVKGRATVADTVAVAARDNPFHPVREYLCSLKWDGERRLHAWLSTYLGASCDPQYLAAIGSKFLISAVARVLSPGCQADHVLVIEGAQGTGKTSTARALAVQGDWFAGNLPDIHSKDAPLQLLGRWIIEIAELKAIRTSQIEATKSFITETADTFRPPYARRSAQFPRQCVFIATTNESEYLRDRTGNRRYWPIRCPRIDVVSLIRDRDQLYAEAVHLFRSGGPWHLTDDEIALATHEQAERVQVSELEAAVAEFLELQAKYGSEVSVHEVLVHALKLDPDKPDFAERARRLGSEVAEAIERAGWKKLGRKGQMRRTMYRLGGRQG